MVEIKIEIDEVEIKAIVKDEWYICAVCDTALPKEWNFG